MIVKGAKYGIYKQLKVFQKAKRPVISVDTKNKEMIRNYKNKGKEWSKKHHPINVKVRDSPDPKVAKAVPYGVYQLARNEAWVRVGLSGDSASLPSLL